MALNIPNVNPAINTLLSGVNTGSSMFERMMQPVLARERMRQQQNQFSQNFGERKNEFMQNYGLQQGAQQRANALLPYLVQQYKDTHKTAQSEVEFKEMYRNLLRNALNTEQSGGSTLPLPTPMPGGEAPAATDQPNAMSVNSGLPLQVNNEAGEQELHPGNPRLTQLDRIAGLVPGIPKPVTHINNGMLLTQYPSGRITAQKIPGIKPISQETPEARQKRETQTRIDAATGIEDAKQASKLQTSGRDLLNLVTRAQKIKKLLDENSDLTGLRQGGLAALNLSQSKKLAEFDQTTRKLQADMARYGSQRGGAQALKWAERSKPGTFKSVDYNQGMIKSILDDSKADYDEMASEYKDRTGKEFPLKFPENNMSPSNQKITKSLVTEENILHTMKETGLSRDEVMKKLKQKGLI